MELDLNYRFSVNIPTLNLENVSSFSVENIEKLLKSIKTQLQPIIPGEIYIRKKYDRTKSYMCESCQGFFTGRGIQSHQANNPNCRTEFTYQYYLSHHWVTSNKHRFLYLTFENKQDSSILSQKLTSFVFDFEGNLIKIT